MICRHPIHHYILPPHTKCSRTRIPDTKAFPEETVKVIRDLRVYLFTIIHMIAFHAFSSSTDMKP